MGDCHRRQMLESGKALPRVWALTRVGESDICVGIADTAFEEELLSRLFRVGCTRAT